MTHKSWQAWLYTANDRVRNSVLFVIVVQSSKLVPSTLRKSIAFTLRWEAFQPEDLSWSLPRRLKRRQKDRAPGSDARVGSHGMTDPPRAGRSCQMKMPVSTRLIVVSSPMSAYPECGWIPIRHTPSTRDSSLLGEMDSKAVTPENPLRIKIAPMTQTGSRVRSTKGARTTWTLSSRKRYLRN